MATAKPITRPIVEPRVFSPLAGVLSYLVPGLGQIMQGRVGKGVLFLVCIYALFFYGIYLGSGSVTLDGQPFKVSSVVYLPDVSEPNSDRGALHQLASNLYNRPQFAGQFWVGIAAWPAIVQYWTYNRDATGHPLLGDFEREPSAASLNAIHNAGDKRLELAWVFTVIAGVLNILVIYDAVAGPAHAASAQEKKD